METAFPRMTDVPEATREKLAQDLRVLIRDAEELLKAGVLEAGGKADELKSRLQASIGRAKESCQRIQDAAVNGAKATDKMIREHPYESIGVALGVGLLIGVLVTRK
ncbi:MAG TPA: DUF883 family protein [Verrucomicrobiae bacterium]|nr:DUF883 family protein [Verrucomicrobiae bacterium]